MAEKASVLVVDDERPLRDLLELLLTHQGYAVQAVADGYAALNLLRGERFDLVVSDLRMAPMDGLTLLRHIVEMQDPPPVVMMTASRSPDLVASVMETGAAAYVMKPFDVKGLMKTVAETIASA